MERGIEASPHPYLDGELRSREETEFDLSYAGGGAENRTPVQSSPLTGVSRLSHQLDLRRRAPDDSRLASQLVQSFPRAYQLRPLEHLPGMTRPRRREQSPVQRLRFN